MSESAAVVIEMRGKQFKWERNDCTVTAFAKLTGMDYAKANQILLLCGRRYGKGVHIEKVLDFLKTNADFLKMLGIDVSQYQFQPILPLPMSVGHLRLTSAKFSGRYLVRISGHVFAMIDGVITDNCSGHMQITGMWQFREQV
jgi:hypothetical protein